MRSQGVHRLILIGLIMAGIAAIFSILKADLYEEFFWDNKGIGGEGSSRGLKDLSPLRNSVEGASRESLSSKVAFTHSAESPGAVPDHAREVGSTRASASVMGPERETSSGSYLVQARSSDSMNTGSRASDREDDQVFGKPQNESRVPAPPDASGSVGDASLKETSLSIPLFYSLKASQFDLLPPEQQQAVVSLQNEYINYHRDWSESSQGDISEWNDRMREFHLELVRKVGAPTADALTR